jgi:hypothetical protein
MRGSSRCWCSVRPPPPVRMSSRSSLSRCRPRSTLPSGRHWASWLQEPAIAGGPLKRPRLAWGSVLRRLRHPRAQGHYQRFRRTRAPSGWPWHRSLLPSAQEPTWSRRLTGTISGCTAPQRCADGTCSRAGAKSQPVVTGSVWCRRWKSSGCGPLLPQKSPVARRAPPPACGTSGPGVCFMTRCAPEASGRQCAGCAGPRLIMPKRAGLF